MIACECQQCGKPLKVKDDLAGKRVKCPECGQAVPVPTLTKLPALSSGVKKTPVPLESSDPDRPTLVPAVAARTPTAEETPSHETVDIDRPQDQPPPELTDFLAPPQGPGEIGRLGPYRVLSVLGAGGMGVVFKAEDPSLQRLVALKAMLPSLAASASARQRFIIEARAAAAIKHDHIVTIHQVSEDRGTPFLAMEFLAGEPLDERLKREKILPVAEIIRIGKEVALALEAAHDVGMIHRDIKPANIWLETRGHGKGATERKRDRATERAGAGPSVSPSRRPSVSPTRAKILDFGLARAAGKESQLTQPGAIIGTPAFMAPEQAAGKEVDSRCDLFSFGCVLYRMCTGELPFKGEDAISTLMAVATALPPAARERNRKVPAALSDLIENLLQKRAHDRPESARAVFEALDAIPIDKTMEQAAAAPARKPQGTGGKKKPWVLAGAIGGALALILAVVFILNRSPSAAPKAQPVTRVRTVPADHLKAEDLSKEDKALAGGGDPDKASPYLVAVLHSGPGKSTNAAIQIGVSADGKTLTSLDGRHVAMWDLASGKELNRHSELFPKRFSAESAVDLNSTGEMLAWDRGNSNVAFFDLTNPKKETLLMLNQLGGASLKTIGFSPDSELFWLLPQVPKATAKIFKTETKQLFSTAGPIVKHERMDVSPDNKTLASVAKGQGRLIFYSIPYVKTKGVKPRTMVVDANCSFVKFSPDGKELVTLAAPGYHFTLWDLATQKEIHQFGGHSKKIRTVAFNPDGKVLASAGDDNIIKVFDRVTHQELHHISIGPKGMEIHQLMFTPEGTHLTVATNLGRVFIHRLPLPVASKPTFASPEPKKEPKQPEEKKNSKEPKEKKAPKDKAEAGWTPLFNGEDLDGWVAANGTYPAMFIRTLLGICRHFQSHPASLTFMNYIWIEAFLYEGRQACLGEHFWGATRRSVFWARAAWGESTSPSSSILAVRSWSRSCMTTSRPIPSFTSAFNAKRC